MSNGMDRDNDSEAVLNDVDLRRRTEALLASAERVSMQLVLQTERLAEAIELFDRDVISPLRKGLS